MIDYYLLYWMTGWTCSVEDLEEAEQGRHLAFGTKRSSLCVDAQFEGETAVQCQSLHSRIRTRRPGKSSPGTRSGDCQHWLMERHSVLRGFRRSSDRAGEDRTARSRNPDAVQTCRRELGQGVPRSNCLPANPPETARGSLDGHRGN